MVAGILAGPGLVASFLLARLRPRHCVCLGYCFLTWCPFPSRLDVSASDSCLFLCQPLAHPELPLEPPLPHRWGCTTPVHCGGPGPSPAGPWPDSEPLGTTHTTGAYEAGGSRLQLTSLLPCGLHDVGKTVLESGCWCPPLPHRDALSGGPCSPPPSPL